MRLIPQLSNKPCYLYLMKLPLRMAWRYLFAKKSTNAINIITLIAAFGVSIGAAALVLTLSVFNGFEDLFLGMFDNLNPDVKITAVKGKSFAFSDTQKDALYAVPGVEQVAQTLEETAVFTYRGKRSAGKIKGVDDNYVKINNIDTTIREGFYQLRDSSDKFSAVVGHQLANALAIDVLDQFEALSVYMAKRERSRSTVLTGTSPPFIRRSVFPVGVLHTQQSFENQAVLLDLGLTRDLLGLGDSTVSAIELRLAAGFATKSTYRAIEAVMGEDFAVKNRLQQESSVLKLMQIEKWISFAIVALMMVMISFNLIGALWMIVLEKKKDIAILQSMGMTPGDIRSIFLRVGLLLCVLGILGGFVIATVLFLAQKQFNLISIPGLEAYPLSLRASDFPIVALVVLLIGFLASLLPAQRAQRTEGVVREE